MAATAEDLREAYLTGRNSNNELTPDMLQKKGWASDRVLRVLNGLVEKRLCSYSKDKVTGKIRVKVREEEVAFAIRPLPPDDYAVYCAIENSGRTGIWTQDICRTTGLQSHVIQRAVKMLSEQKKLIKPLKSIHQKNRRIYILANLQPSKEVVGGTFYENGEFNDGLVERLRAQIMNIFQNGSKASFKDVSSYVRSCGFGNEFADNDLLLVLKTLQLEQRIQVSLHPSTGEAVYSWCRWTSNDNSFASIPCFSCPISEECLRYNGARVSPPNCKYMDVWLNYDIEDGLENSSKGG